MTTNDKDQYNNTKFNKCLLKLFLSSLCISDSFFKTSE